MIVGFNIDNVKAERLTEKPSKISVKNRVQITGVEESKFPMANNKLVLKFAFNFGVIYEPKVANIEINGTISYVGDENTDIIKEYKKTKKIKHAKVSAQILNTILSRCNIKALTLSQDLALPAPIELPKVKMKGTSAASYIG